ncbi:MAG: hypothetical protein RSC68_27800 [Acinetobacter sp.]
MVACINALIATSAFAVDNKTNYKFAINNAGCVVGTTAEYTFSTNYKLKDSTITYIEVRHTVEGSAAGFTNLIAAGRPDRTFVGSKWMASNEIYYSTNGGCSSGNSYAPCGRGNTKYHDQYGLTSLTMSGQFRIR